MSYRMAGSFVLHLTERFGLAAVLGFFPGKHPDDAAGTIDTRMQAAFGVSLADAESAWLAMLRTQ